MWSASASHAPSLAILPWAQQRSEATQASEETQGEEAQQRQRGLLAREAWGVLCPSLSLRLRLCRLHGDVPLVSPLSPLLSLAVRLQEEQRDSSERQWGS